MTRLGDLERAAMDVLWGGPATGMTVREVLDTLAGRDLAYTTVMTVLDRLAGKRMVVRERDGQAWRYQPAAPREAYIAQLMLDALDLAQPPAAGPRRAEQGADSGDRGAALVHFARAVSGDEAELLRQALEEQAGSDARPDGRRRRTGRRAAAGEA